MRSLSKFLYLDVVLNSERPTIPLVSAAVVVAALNYAVFRKAGLHELASYSSRTLDAKRVGLMLALVFLLFIGMLFAFKMSATLSHGWICLWFIASYVLLLVFRVVLKRHVTSLGAEGRFRERVSIYGSCASSMRLISEIVAHNPNVIIAGIFDDAEPGRPAKTSLKVGNLDDLVTSGQTDQCDRIIVVLSAHTHERIRSVLAKLARLPVVVQVYQDSVLLPCPVLGVSAVGRVLLFDAQLTPLSARNLIFKMLVDRTLAAITLAAIAPLMLLLAIAIKLDSRGPVFFVQSRHGYNHRVIRVIKFRTMTVMEEGQEIVQAQRNDMRTTRVGRFLRQTSFDEVPQLINVVRGELSLVGPRPHALAHNDYYTELIEDYACRHKIKPGITGWAQVNGFRGETRDPELMRNRVQLDIWYLNNWSLWLDLRILIKTLMVPFDRNVY